MMKRLHLKDPLESGKYLVSWERGAQNFTQFFLGLLNCHKSRGIPMKGESIIAKAAQSRKQEENLLSKFCRARNPYSPRALAEPIITGLSSWARFVMFSKVKPK